MVTCPSQSFLVPLAFGMVQSGVLQEEPESFEAKGERSCHGEYTVRAPPNSSPLFPPHHHLQERRGVYPGQTWGPCWLESVVPSSSLAFPVWSGLQLEAFTLERGEKGRVEGAGTTNTRVPV